MRLDKYLADCGKGTRSELKDMIKKGLVSVNGSIVRDAAFKTKESDEVLLSGSPVAYSKYVYIMLNKPAGVVSATEDKQYKTVLDLIGDEYKNFDLFPVGRLDIDTEGLLLLTNDGEMAHRALSPSHHVEKTYYVKTALPIAQDVVSLFSDGVFIAGGHKTLPARLVIKGSCEALLTITEGKYHQVKLMFETTGNKVVYLKRVAFGKLSLPDGLLPGNYLPVPTLTDIF